MRSKYKKPYRKTQKRSTEQSIIWTILSVPFKLLGLFFKKNQVKSYDKKLIIKRWYWIRQILDSGEDSDLRSAVIEADKLMDFALKSARFPGNKFADRIRSAKKVYSKNVYSGIWQAHILRNDLVHNINSKINSFEAKDAIKKVHQGLRGIKGI